MGMGRIGIMMQGKDPALVIAEAVTVEAGEEVKKWYRGSRYHLHHQQVITQLAMRVVPSPLLWYLQNP